MNITDGNASLTGLLNGRSVAYYDGDDITAPPNPISNMVRLDQSVLFNRGLESRMRGSTVE